MLNVHEVFSEYSIEVEFENNKYRILEVLSSGHLLVMKSEDKYPAQPVVIPDNRYKK